MTRPFNILAFGDSIMWGQGLTQDLKFATLVKNWVASQLPGRSVTLQSFAHSGAIIQPSLSAAQDAVVHDGEVPEDYPSITAQLSRAIAAVSPAEIDLVLLNGGANDVGLVSTILNPFVSSESVSEKTRDRLTGQMNSLLPRAVSDFPNAKIIVPGYYPMITNDSPLPELIALFVGLGIVIPDPLADAILTAACRDTVIQHSRAFFAESDAGLRSAVDAQNTRTPNRCVYASPGFAGTNAYGASDRFVFNVLEHDPMFDARQPQCSQAGQGGVSECATASVGHPNAKGAQKYASAMTSQLAPFVPKWQGLRTLRACVDPKPVIGAAGSYTIWVEDAESRLPVQATVTVGTQTVNANTSFMHTFACVAGETETIPSTMPGKPAKTVTLPKTCDAILISAPGYITLPVRYATV
ncbi:MAG: SGNH/GDSL hydrolase family protein [Gemmatimonadota bacterium]|nr:SGNH/GDSL hydrolase family protein [Gemmatimonadota bacterium]